MTTHNCEIKLLPHNRVAPKRATPGSAAYDIHLPTISGIYKKMYDGPDKPFNEVQLQQYELSNRKLYMNIAMGYVIHTGICFNLADPRFAIIALPRSGFGSRGLSITNTIGLLDSDYQGELILHIHQQNELNVTPIVLEMDKPFAQFICVPVVELEFPTVENFQFSTSRGAGGFGHTDGK
jgi:dUTPase